MTASQALKRAGPKTAVAGGGWGIVDFDGIKRALLGVAGESLRAPCDFPTLPFSAVTCDLAFGSFANDKQVALPNGATPFRCHRPDVLKGESHQISPVETAQHEKKLYD